MNIYLNSLITIVVDPDSKYIKMKFIFVIKSIS